MLFNGAGTVDKNGAYEKLSSAQSKNNHRTLYLKNKMVSLYQAKLSNLGKGLKKELLFSESIV